MADEGRPEAAPRAPTLRHVLEPLLPVPADQLSFAAQQLVACLSHMEHTQQQLRNRKSPEAETLADQDRLAIIHANGLIEDWKYKCWQASNPHFLQLVFCSALHAMLAHPNRRWMHC
jgi:hypothetical protein